MLEKLKENLEELKKHKNFKEFAKENNDTYLASFFFIMQQDSYGEVQVSFYSPKKNSLTTFMVEQDFKKSTEEIFQKEKHKVEKLDLDKVNVNFLQALDEVDSLLEKKYSEETPNKIIVVLQNLKGRILWNLTYLTNNFNILNVRIDAVSGNIIEEKLESIMHFRK